MLVSLNWIRDFVDLPKKVSSEELADRFTITCAEVEGVEAIEVGATGLICAEVTKIVPLGGPQNLQLASLDMGGGKSVETVTAAPNLSVGARVVYAPVGASVKALGTIRESTVSGKRSCGMILPGDALGIAMAVREAIFLPPYVEPGTELEPEPFDDWVVEIDNHSINHRPDLWGHYGIAREFAAMYGVALKPYPVTPLKELQDPARQEIPIVIDDPDACPRYSGLLMQGVESQPGPLWMQLRLGHVGMRPIDCLVDLTNYIMAELGQPMHAFDGDHIERIEVGFVEAGTRFTTLDNVERTLSDEVLMILSNRRPVAMAGIMGGSETEISETTQSILLESANFNAHTIRRGANLLKHRTDASARFEKSLDPAHTVLGIQRFVHLARAEFKDFKLAGRLSDAFPKPLPETTITIDPEFVSRFMGHPVSRERITEILTALEFTVADDGAAMTVKAPSFRATRDIEIEADVIEEIARYVGYNNIEPAFPRVSVRAMTPNRLQQLEGRSLHLLTLGLGLTEIHGYIWYDAEWCDKLGYHPEGCLTLRNPAAAGMERLRQSLVPGLLAAAERNRHHFDEFRIVELGSVFPSGDGEMIERRRFGIVSAVRRKQMDDRRIVELKGVIDAWAWQMFSLPATYQQLGAEPGRPWDHPHKTASVSIGECVVGRIGAVPFELRQKIDEHLAAWSLVWAEIDLDDLAKQGERLEKLPPVPAFPEVELDFSVLVDGDRRYAEVAAEIGKFNNPLLRRISFVDSYEGKSVPSGKRAFTFRTRIGDPSRTLVEQDLVAFRKSFQEHLRQCGLELRGA
ncbi:MAG: phenylalanine--tRNA ligase subunit beta [Planctomycetes bacterium]|nr:phenylalanine--tRNA ligase subunit beta [Planctomycetota bacterium]